MLILGAQLGPCQLHLGQQAELLILLIDQTQSDSKDGVFFDVAAARGWVGGTVTRCSWYLLLDTGETQARASGNRHQDLLTADRRQPR